MRRITEEHLADLCEADYRNLMGVTREEFGRMLQALEEGYRREHKRKPRFTKITMVDKLILTLTYRCQYRSMDSIAKEYEVSLDTISDNIHWVEQTLLNADLLESSVTCVYKTMPEQRLIDPEALTRSLFSGLRRGFCFAPARNAVFRPGKSLILHLEFFRKE